jgi:hypothetical protein
MRTAATAQRQRSWRIEDESLDADLIDERSQIAHGLLHVDIAFLACAREGAEIGAGIQDRQFFGVGVTFEVPSQRGGLFEDVHGPFVGCDEHAFFAAL